jgi:hypothetical protein
VYWLSPSLPKSVISRLSPADLSRVDDQLGIHVDPDSVVKDVGELVV